MEHLQSLFNLSQIAYCSSSKESNRDSKLFPNGIAKGLLYINIWSHLQLMFRSNHPTEAVQKWRSRLHGHGISHHTWCWALFDKAHMVYAKLHVGLQDGLFYSLKSSKFYIGSTAKSMYGRDQSRKRKSKQLKKGKLVKAELVLQYWKHYQNEHEYALLPIGSAPDERFIRIRELVLIQKWQPILNYPFICQLKFKSTSIGTQIVPKKHGHKLVGSRLFQKVRKRLFKIGRLNNVQTAATDHTHSWSILKDIGSNTLRSFDRIKELRSNRTSGHQVLALFKLASNMEEPFKSNVRSQLGKVLEFKNLVKPKHNKPLSLPHLAGQSFKGVFKQMLRDHVKENMESIPSFHIPTSTIVEAKHKTVESLLFNHFKFFKKWEDEPPTTCPCAKFLQKHPNAAQVDGHVASPADLMNLPTKVLRIAQYATNSQYYEAKEAYLQQILPRIEAWTKWHVLPPIPESTIRSKLDTVWPEHKKASQDTITSKDVFLIKQQTKGLVVHCQDHQPHRLCIFCPCLYHKTIKDTFFDPQVYEEINMTAEECIQHARDIIPDNINKSYPWGIAKKPKAARAYAFLKKKKKYKVARSIISYKNTILAKLLRATALVLFDVAQVAFPSSFGNLNMDQTWKYLHTFFQELDLESHLSFHNDDLTGFFTSIPQQRITDAVEFCLDLYHKNNCKKPREQVFFTVDLAEKNAKLRLSQGKVSRRSKSQVLICLADILDIVKLSFATGMFTILGKSFRQIRGTCIGNQISPVISQIAVAVKEHFWIQSFDFFWQSHKHFICAIRYVDNRLLLIPSSLGSNPAIKELVKLDFYEPPVQLEEVGNDEFLGFHLSANERTAKLIMPTEKWQYRCPQSAGSNAIMMSGYKSRLVRVQRYTFPPEIVPQQIQILKDLYSKHGFNV